MTNYALVTETTQIKMAPGMLKGFYISSVTGSPTITIYDSAVGSTSLKIVDTFVAIAAIPFLINKDGPFFKNGLYVVISGAVSVTFFFD